MHLIVVEKLMRIQCSAASAQVSCLAETERFEYWEMNRFHHIHAVNAIDRLDF